jgi:hypothetical protein
MTVLLEASGESRDAMHRALAFWTRLHGVLSLELAGMAVDPVRGMDEEIAALSGVRVGSDRS